MSKYPNPSSYAPTSILSLNTILNITHELKERNAVIGITHGAFDLFHLSHLSLLKQSSKLCDYFIVGVDSDKNISKYKSYKRPINPQEERMSIIGELSCTDAVFLNTTNLNSEDYQKLYKELNVDFVTIGLHFEFVEGAQESTTKAGCELKKINTPQYPTTTRIVNTIIDKYTD